MRHEKPAKVGPKEAAQRAQREAQYEREQKAKRERERSAPLTLASIRPLRYKNG